MLTESKDISIFLRQVFKDPDAEHFKSSNHRSKSVDDFIWKRNHAQVMDRNQSADNINQTDYEVSTISPLG